MKRLTYMLLDILLAWARSIPQLHAQLLLTVLFVVSGSASAATKDCTPTPTTFNVESLNGTYDVVFASVTGNTAYTATYTGSDLALKDACGTTVGSVYVTTPAYDTVRFTISGATATAAGNYTIEVPAGALTFKHTVKILDLTQPAFTITLAYAGGTESGSGFNPVNPGDPDLPVFKEYRNVTVTCTPVDAGSVSRSGSSSKNGKFEVGTSVRISRSANAKFVFKHWLKNGEVYTAAGTSTSFYYTVEEQDAAFVAVYDYNPTSPVDPNGVVSSKLYLQCEPAGACSFALTSGVGHEVDTYVKLGVYPNQDYEFIGWYEGNTFVSNVANVNYLMPYHDTTLTARFRYTWKFTPDNPDDPASQGGDIQTEDYLTGDVNRDGKVTMADAVATLNYYLQWTAASSDDAKYDVNHDGKITVADAVDVMNIYLTAQ